MRKISGFLFLITLLFSILACQTLTRPFLLTPTPSLTQPLPVSSSPTIPAPTETSLPSATPTEPPEILPSPTPSITATPSPSHTPQSTPLSIDVQLGIFEELWSTINEGYLYPDFNGQDWDAVYDEFRQRVQSGLSSEDFYAAMAEMVERLGDDHSVYLNPAETAQEDAEYAGNVNYVGIGVLVSAIPERGRALILVVFPGSPAAQAGLQARDSIISVDGEAILDEYGYLKDIVRGPEGSLVILLVESPGSTPRQVSILRRPISGGVPVHHTVLSSPDGHRIGYIFLVTFSDSTIDEQVGEALRAMSSAEPLDGLIIDNRENSGGADTVMRPILGYFTSGEVGHFISRDEQRPLEIRIEEVNNSASLPLVVLVGKNTISYGEIFAGILKDTGRAYLIGETSEGNVETLWGYDFEDGSRTWIAHESFRPAKHPEEDWEETGVIPHLEVVAFIGDYSLEDDPAVMAALAYLDAK